MKFVLVNRRTPVVPSKCKARRRPVEKGYLRDLSTLRRYYPDGMGTSHLFDHTQRSTRTDR